jgi:hypothetical protein
LVAEDFDLPNLPVVALSWKGGREGGQDWRGWSDQKIKKENDNDTPTKKD